MTPAVALSLSVAGPLPLGRDAKVIACPGLLDSCLVFVAHNRSPCVSHMLERVGEDPRPLSGAHVFILQQAGVTKRQVIAAWLSGI